MSQANQSGRRWDGITILSGGLSTMLTLPLAPKFMRFTEARTYNSLAENYGRDLADIGMLLHAAASFVVTFLALLIIFEIGLRLLIKKIGRIAGRSR